MAATVWTLVWHQREPPSVKWVKQSQQTSGQETWQLGCNQSPMTQQELPSEDFLPSFLSFSTSFQTHHTFQGHRGSELGRNSYLTLFFWVRQSARGQSDSGSHIHTSKKSASLLLCWAAWSAYRPVHGLSWSLGNYLLMLFCNNLTGCMCGTK